MRKKKVWRKNHKHTQQQQWKENFQAFLAVLLKIPLSGRVLPLCLHPPHLVSIPKKASDSTPGTQHPEWNPTSKGMTLQKMKKKSSPWSETCFPPPTARISPLLLLMPFAKGVRGAAKVEKKRRSDFAFDLWQQQKETNSQVVWLINKQEQLILDKVLRRTGWKKINLDNEAEKKRELSPRVCVRVILMFG